MYSCQQYDRFDQTPTVVSNASVHQLPLPSVCIDQYCSDTLLIIVPKPDRNQSDFKHYKRKQSDQGIITSIPTLLVACSNMVSRIVTTDMPRAAILKTR
ncbi:hypothetical protein K461DRAFT_172505 [Myriangium duriaei CBS 260.36]|uniref:Uncharacterized protein n=1 Tax=Myriangium duriaei CBS 260.36 TaxID=1168546 RepID=A0A9P4IZ83_9PEZI|nr:hypothetical protein K461DRAFT_172505 [Myriangium duriaei CBS 260.36]